MADEELDDEVDGDIGDDQDEDGEGGGRKKRSGKKLFLIIGVALLLIIGGAAAAYFTGLLEPLMGSSSGHSGEEQKGDGHAEPVKPGDVVFYELPEMMVNLNAQGRKTSYLKIRVSLELASQDDVPTVEAAKPRIIDNFQVYLRELRLEDLKGSAGVYRLREELLTRVNAAVEPARVNDVLFNEMLVQ